MRSSLEKATWSISNRCPIQGLTVGRNFVSSPSKRELRVIACVKTSDSAIVAKSEGQLLLFCLKQQNSFFANKKETKRNHLYTTFSTTYIRAIDQIQTKRNHPYTALSTPYMTSPTHLYDLIHLGSTRDPTKSTPSPLEPHQDSGRVLDKLLSWPHHGPTRPHPDPTRPHLRPTRGPSAQNSSHSS